MADQNMLTINTCKTHGTGYFTAPNKGGQSYCVKCVHNGMKKSPKSFFVTEHFRKLVEFHAEWPS